VSDYLRQNLDKRLVDIDYAEFPPFVESSVSDHKPSETNGAVLEGGMGVNLENKVASSQNPRKRRRKLRTARRLQAESLAQAETQNSHCVQMAG
jgi:hypothetical protein